MRGKDAGRVHETKIYLPEHGTALPLHGKPMRDVRPLLDASTGLQASATVERLVGAGIRKRRMTQQISLFSSADGRLWYEIAEAWLAEDPLHIDDPDAPWASFERIAHYARDLLDEFGLPRADMPLAQNNEPVSFWENDLGELSWGACAPHNVIGTRASHISSDMADRIAFERGGLNPSSRAAELPFAVGFLDLLPQLENERDAWTRRRSDKPPVDPNVALDIGYTLGMEMGALIAEWRLAREFGHVIIASQKRDLNRPPPPVRASINRSKLFAKAGACRQRHPTWSVARIARLVAPEVGAAPGTVRNILSKNKERW